MTVRQDRMSFVERTYSEGKKRLTASSVADSFVPSIMGRLGGRCDFCPHSWPTDACQLGRPEEPLSYPRRTYVQGFSSAVRQGGRCFSAAMKRFSDRARVHCSHGAEVFGAQFAAEEEVTLSSGQRSKGTIAFRGASLIGFPPYLSIYAQH